MDVLHDAGAIGPASAALIAFARIGEKEWS
jgi:hypothetical protein